jgi:hypothetical protein
MGGGWRPARCGYHYVVQSGDLLGDVVRNRYGLQDAALNQKLHDVAALIHIDDADRIDAGDVSVLEM